MNPRNLRIDLRASLKWDQVARLWNSRTQLRHLPNSSLQPENEGDEHKVAGKLFLREKASRQKDSAQH